MSFSSLREKGIFELKLARYIVRFLLHTQESFSEKHNKSLVSNNLDAQIFQQQLVAVKQVYF